MRPVLFKL